MFYLTCVSISSMSEILSFIMCILLVRLASEFPAQVREFAGVTSLFPPHGAQESNLGHLAWQQAPFPLSHIVSP